LKKFYITTPIYYVNSLPHIGHAYTTIAADVVARWNRLIGREVFFLTGTDEHGAKIAEAAAEKGEEPNAFVNQIASEYKKRWQILNISNDDFIQTTEDRHMKRVQAAFEKLLKSGDIYKGVYEDWYCLSDEAYFSDSDLQDGKCPLCGREVKKLKEESYFFKLSKYQDALLDLYEKNPEFLSPKFRRNEIVNFVKSGLRDLSVSRTRITWGIPVLSDPKHVIYVWFDALMNYVTAPGYDAAKANPMTRPFSDFWPADIHFVGKEIFRFHAVIWPAMLMALGVPVPKKVFAHGWWTVEGQKMSKSVGNVIDPQKMAEEYGVDSFRYFLFREVPFGSDGDFSEKALLQRYNSELANNLGNLLQRTTTIIQKNLGGIVPNFPEPPALLKDIPQIVQSIVKSFEELALEDVLETIVEIMVKTNQFIDEKAPWTLSAGQKEALEKIMYECMGSLKILAVLLAPFMPSKMQEIWERIGEKGRVEKEGIKILGPLLGGSAKEYHPKFSPGQTAVKGDPVFMRKGGRHR